MKQTHCTGAHKYWREGGGWLATLSTSFGSAPVSGTRTCTTQTNEFWLEMQTFAVKRQKDFTTPLVPPLHKNSIMISWDHSSLQFTQCSLHCRHNCNQDMFDLKDMRLSLQTTTCTGHMHTVLIHASLTAIAMPCLYRDHPVDLICHASISYLKTY